MPEYGDGGDGGGGGAATAAASNNYSINSTVALLTVTPFVVSNIAGTGRAQLCAGGLQLQRKTDC